jgi:hypothetical protein
VVAVRSAVGLLDALAERLLALGDAYVLFTSRACALCGFARAMRVREVLADLLRDVGVTFVFGCRLFMRPRGLLRRVRWPP